MLFVAIGLYSLSFLAQLGAAIFAFTLAAKATKNYKWGWTFLGIGTALMLGRRISPIQAIIDTSYFNIVDALLSVPISLCLLIGIFGIYRSMTKYASDSEFITAMAQIDPLTGCFSRTELNFRLQTELKRAQRSGSPLAVCELDIDHFKYVNDHYGHHVGDAILSMLATCAKSQLRASDILGRVGGEEFVIVMPETDATEGFAVAERLRQHVESYGFNVESVSTPLHITISLGLTSYIARENNANPETISSSLLKQADLAMYTAKRNGRNQVCVCGPPN